MTEGESRRWYSRSDIARELEILGGEIVRRGRVLANSGVIAVGNAMLDHADKVRGELGEQAEREARDDIKRREENGEWVPTIYDTMRE